MNAIRRDEMTDNLHSIYVDQWDWELVISREDRNTEFLYDIVRKIYAVVRDAEREVSKTFEIEAKLPDEITFVTTHELEDMYPNLTAKERENLAAKEYGAIFIIGIGGQFEDGSIHDGRAPDYDDWITETGDGHRGLNGDLLVWNPILESAFELSSMGIRVSPESLKAQLEQRGCMEREKLEFHSKLLKGELAFTMGGGIGQSRLCMYLLRKAHIGETQVSAWPPEMLEECKKAGIPLL